MKRLPILNRLENGTRSAVGGCLLWQGHLDRQGYGRILYKGTHWRVNRLVYTLYRGAIPKGLVLVPTCGDSACVYPRHLEPMSYKDMLLRRRRHTGPTTAEGRKRCRLANLGSNSTSWKGDQIGYTALHSWMRKQIPKPRHCALCGAPPHDLTNISGGYKRDTSDWRWLCRRCHMITDGRMEKLKQRNRRGKADAKQSDMPRSQGMRRT